MEVDLAALVQGLGDAVVVADREGTIRLWNLAAERLFGYGADAALGRSLDLIIPERFRERHWAGYRAVIASGVRSPWSGTPRGPSRASPP